MANKKSAKKSAAKRTPAKRRMSYKDVQIAFLSNGVSAIEKLLADGTTTKTAVRRALEAFEASGQKVASLAEYVAANLGTGRRGRSTPTAGASRSYKAQQIGTGSSFLRLPLDAIGVKKGGAVGVRFERDQIIVVRG